MPPVAPAPALETTTAPGALALTTPTPATDSVDTDLSPNTAAVGDIVVDLPAAEDDVYGPDAGCEEGEQGAESTE